MWYPFSPGDIFDQPEFVKLGPDAALLYVLISMRVLEHGPIEVDLPVFKALWGGRVRKFKTSIQEALSALERDEFGKISPAFALSARDDCAKRMKYERDKKRLQRSKTSYVPGDIPRDTPGTSPGRPDRQTGQTDRQDKQARAPRAAPSAPSGEHAEFIAWWCEAFQQATGSPYGFQGGKDGKHVQRILARQGGAPEARRRAAILFGCAPEWMAAGGIDLGTLDAQWNKLASAGQVKIATGSKQLAMREAQEQPRIGLYTPITPKLEQKP